MRVGLESPTLILERTMPVRTSMGERAGPGIDEVGLIMNLTKSLAGTALTASFVVLLAALVAATPARAAFITNQEGGMTGVFSQASFGSTPIDIRWGPSVTVVAPTLLDITTDAEVTQVFNLFGGSPTVNFYFIDTISACGGTIAPGIVGCGAFPGNDFVVESTFAAGAFGVELLSHELAHNLGVGHRSSSTALMNPSLNGGTTLNASEVATILASGLIQSDQNGFFIDVQPVLILASAVPIPSAGLLLVGGLAGLLFMRRRKGSVASTT